MWRSTKEDLRSDTKRSRSKEEEKENGKTSVSDAKEKDQRTALPNEKSIQDELILPPHGILGEEGVKKYRKWC